MEAEDTSLVEGTLPPNFVVHSEVLITGTTLNMTDGGENPLTGLSFVVAKETAEEVASLYN